MRSSSARRPGDDGQAPPPAPACPGRPDSLGPAGWLVLGPGGLSAGPRPLSARASGSRRPRGQLEPLLGRGASPRPWGLASTRPRCWAARVGESWPARLGSSFSPRVQGLEWERGAGARLLEEAGGQPRSKQGSACLLAPQGSLLAIISAFSIPAFERYASGKVLGLLVGRESCFLHRNGPLRCSEAVLERKGLVMELMLDPLMWHVLLSGRFGFLDTV